MIVTLGLVAVMLLGVTYAYAQGPGMGPGHRGMHESWGPGKDSSLTPEQKTKFQELRRKFSERKCKTDRCNGDQEAGASIFMD